MDGAYCHYCRRAKCICDEPADITPEERAEKVMDDWHDGHRLNEGQKKCVDRLRKLLLAAFSSERDAATAAERERCIDIVRRRFSEKPTAPVEVGYVIEDIREKGRQP